MTTDDCRFRSSCDGLWMRAHLACSASVNEPDAIRVLLIKDGAIDRGFLANELSKQGFAVQTVASLAGVT